MEYKGYKLKEEDNKVIVENVRDFNPVHIFECGQCFRWIKQKDGSYTGVAKNRVANMKLEDTSLIISNSSIQDFINIWFEYLDLGTDYADLKKQFAKDEIMLRAIDYGYGIRLLKQDTWETLISFILSANNMIPRIMKSVSTLSKVFGDELEYNGEKFYTFPDINSLADSSLEQVELCGGGFRCKYILHTSQIVQNGQIDLEALRGLSADDSRKELMKLLGVGPKVADCVMLFSGISYDVFPTDVWIKRVMEELYFKREATLKEIQSFASDYFGELKGIAQQYLFYYARGNRIGGR